MDPIEVVESVAQHRLAPREVRRAGAMVAHARNAIAHAAQNEPLAAAADLARVVGQVHPVGRIVEVVDKLSSASTVADVVEAIASLHPVTALVSSIFSFFRELGEEEVVTRSRALANQRGYVIPAAVPYRPASPGAAPAVSLRKARAQAFTSLNPLELVRNPQKLVDAAFIHAIGKARIDSANRRVIINMYKGDDIVTATAKVWLPSVFLPSRRKKLRDGTDEFELYGVDPMVAASVEAGERLLMPDSMVFTSVHDVTSLLVDEMYSMNREMDELFQAEARNKAMEAYAKVRSMHEALRRLDKERIAKTVVAAMPAPEAEQTLQAIAEDLTDPDLASTFDDEYCNVDETPWLRFIAFRNGTPPDRITLVNEDPNVNTIPNVGWNSYSTGSARSHGVSALIAFQRQRHF